MQQMLDLHKRQALARTEHERTLLQRQINAMDKEIDPDSLTDLRIERINDG